MTSGGSIAGIVAGSPAPESADNQLKFELQNRAWTSEITTGEGDGIQTGYARIKSSDGSAGPAGMAIFGYRRDGILVSEATVPISQWVESGRIPAQLDGMVNTGLAFANPNRGAVGVDFYFSDASGMTMYSGSFNLPGRRLNERVCGPKSFRSSRRPGNRFEESAHVDVHRLGAGRSDGAYADSPTSVQIFCSPHCRSLLSARPSRARLSLLTLLKAEAGKPNSCWLIRPTTICPDPAYFYTQGSAGSAPIRSSWFATALGRERL